jgi:hypothetical protein
MFLGVSAVLSVLAAAPGCRRDGDGVAVARLGAERTAVAPASGLARRLWVGEYTDFYASAISPDGRYVTQVDWTTGDLAVRDLATGSLHRLTDKGPPEESVDYAQNAKFSRDGRRIAYAWYDASMSDYEIHVLDFNVDDRGVPHGSGTRVVYAAGVPQPTTGVFDWVSDDDVLIGLYRPDNSTALARLSLSTGSLDVLALATGTRTGEAIHTTLQVIATDGSQARTVYRGAGAKSPLPFDSDALPVGSVLFCQCRVVGWSPDSRSILFLDLVDRTPDEPRDVELLRVSRDGGAVERVATIPDYDRGATLHPDGRTIAYRTGEWRGEIWAMDALGGTVSTATELEGSR